MAVTIRHERTSDVLAIRELTIAAFTQSDLGYHGEAEIIEQLREACPEIVSLVAEERGQIAGHILFSPVQIVGERQTVAGMGLAPMSVLPAFQNQGLGSLLVQRGLEILEDSRCPFLVVLGHAEFYARFGFEPAGEFGIVSEFAGIPDEIFRIKCLSLPLANLPRGTARYRREFSVDESTQTESD